MGNENLREFIRNRTIYLVNKKREIEQELDQLGKSADILENLISNKHVSPKIHLQDMIRDVLLEREDGLTSQEIRCELGKRYKVYMDRSNLTPTLSRLKSAGTLKLTDNRRWLLS